MFTADIPSSLFLVIATCCIWGVVAQVQSDLCPETCVERTCQNPERNNLICTHGCVNGYWGDRCYNECPVNCATCHKNFGGSGGQRECYTCKDGFYTTGTDTECSLACLPQCRACNSESDCTACTDGYYLDNTQCQPCPPRCSQCTSENVCTECASEHYTGVLCEECLDGRLGVMCESVQSNLCPETCVDRTCQEPENNNLTCTHGCVGGYWGNRCYNECPANCATCHRQFGASIGKRECYTCKDGFYLTDTDKECSLACLPQCRACNNDSDCTACTDGYFLDNAQCQSCPPRCIKCTSDNLCTECSSEHYTGSLCEECLDGRLGDMCESVQSNLCPETCVDRTCQEPENNNLTCTHGCVGGYWGNRCYNECPANCATCHRQFGASGGKRECYTCKDGFFITNIGTECTLACLPQCRACNSESNCTACTDRYYNSETVTNCSLTTTPCPSNCESCLSETECNTCKQGYHNTATANDCSNSCPAECVTCDSATACTRCVTNRQGPVCKECVDETYGESCMEDADASISAGTIAGIAVGGTIGLAIVVLLIVIAVIMYKRLEHTRGQARRAENDTDTPRNIYDDLKIEDSTGTNENYASLDHESGNRNNEPRADDTTRPEYINMGVELGQRQSRSC